MPKKKPIDPRMQALVDQALASSDPIGFVNELARLVQAGSSEPFFAENPEIELPDPPLHPALLTVRADIVGAEPPIWRRLELRGDLTLPAIHDRLQAGFGWLDSHLHRFDAPGVSRRGPYFVTESDIEEGDTGTLEDEVRLDQVLREPGDRLRYTYDFGDDWEHRIVVESVRPATTEDPPARCTDGRGACPPEDVGGISSWNDLAAALRADPDPAHLTGELATYADWLPPDCDPDDFVMERTDVILSLVGADGETAIKALAALAPRVLAPGAMAPGAGSGLPQPGPELAQLLGRCPDEVVDNIAAITARAVDLDDAVTDADVDTGLALRPWRVVLDTIGDAGVQLTAAGWLPPATVRRIWEESGVAWAYGKGNREQHTPEVAALREQCVHAGLLRKHKGRLLPTKRGRVCRASDAQLLSAIAQSLLRDKHDVVQDARVISLLLISADWQLGADSRWATHAAERGEPLRPWEISQAFWDDVADLMNDVGWRLVDGRPLHRDDLGYASHRAVQVLLAGDVLGELPHSPVARRMALAALFR